MNILPQVFREKHTVKEKLLTILLFIDYGLNFEVWILRGIG